jgi:hypothetical protein
MKGESLQGGAWKPGQGLADGGGSREDLTALVDQMQLFAAALQ